MHIWNEDRYSPKSAAKDSLQQIAAHPQQLNNARTALYPDVSLWPWHQLRPLPKQKSPTRHSASNSKNSLHSTLLGTDRYDTSPYYTTPFAVLESKLNATVKELAFRLEFDHPEHGLQAP